MFKRTLIAASVAAVISSPAMSWERQLSGQTQHQTAESEAVALSQNSDLVNSRIDLSDHSNTSITNKETANSAIAGPLVTGIQTCLGSTTAAVQGLTFGASVGSTVIDENCVMRLNAAFMAKLGDVKAARMLICQDDKIRTAYSYTDTPCPAMIKARFERMSPPSNVDPVIEHHLFAE